MTSAEIKATLDGANGDEAQFEMMKFVIKAQIDRAFAGYKVRGGNNLQVRSGHSQPFISYNERGNSNFYRQPRR